MTEFEKTSDVYAVCERILERIALPMDYNNQRLHVSTSIGCAFFPDDGKDKETLLHTADNELYAAKKGGKNAFSSSHKE